MLCPRCGQPTPAAATTCPRCGTTSPHPLPAPVTAARPSLTASRPAAQRGLDTSWLPRTPTATTEPAARSGLVPDRPSSSIWQTASRPAPRTLPGAQLAAALAIPGIVMAVVYAIFQVVWRRGVFAAIATSPFDVAPYTAQRSDDLNLVLLVVTIVLVVLSCAGALWWIRKTRLRHAFRSPVIVVGVGVLLTVVAAVLCQVGSTMTIAYAYVVGGIGCSVIAAGLGIVLARAVRAVTGDLRWVPRQHHDLPVRAAAGPGLSPTAVAKLAPTASNSAVRDVRTSGLVPPAPDTARPDWSSLTRR